MVRTVDPKTKARILQLFKKHGGWLRQVDLVASGFHPRWLSRLVQENAVERVRKGLYRLAEVPTVSNQDLADACKAIPRGVVCLLSALSYYGLTNVNPPEVYLAIGRKAWVPKVGYPPIRFFRFSHPMLALGVRLVESRKGAIRIFDEEKTLCDALRHRVIVGQDVAVEALRAYLRRRDKNISKLLRISRACRGERRLKAYLEALL